MENEIKTYMGLDVWNKSHELVLRTYKITRDFPKHELFGLSSQLRRAASSVPANIAEGNGKQYLRGYIQSLYISRGSLNETKYFYLLSKDLEYITEDLFNETDKFIDRITMMLMGLIRSLKAKLAEREKKKTKSY